MMVESTHKSPVLVNGGEELRRIGDLVVSVANRERVILAVQYDCEDCYYSFYQYIPLGQILTSIGLTAEDCARAIEAWGAHLEACKARPTEVVGDV